MTDYKKLVEALRWCSVDEYVPCTGCPMNEETHGTGCFNIMHQRAAAAIEELQAEVESMDESCKKQLVAMASHVADLQAEVERLQVDVEAAYALMEVQE